MTAKAKDNSPPKQTWTLKRVLELETQLFHDQNKEEDTLSARDQSIGETIASEATTPPDSQTYVTNWLYKLRQNKPASELDATNLLSEAPRRSSQALSVLYFITGLSVSWSLLRYTGEQPVNVSAYFGIVILLQALLAIFSLAILIAGSNKPKASEFSIGAGIAKFLSIGLVSLFARISSFAISGTQREELLAQIGRFRSRVWIYQKPLRWAFFRLAQTFGIAFNFGVLTALIAAVTFSDRAFGWQTSLNVSAESIHALIHTMAIPWSWLLTEGKGLPSLDQVSGSQIILKDGMLALRTTDLTSWWSFLTLATITYGLLPRVILSQLSKYQLKKELKKIDLSNSETKRVLRRLRSHEYTFAATTVKSANIAGANGASNPLAQDSQTESYKVWVSPSLDSQFSGIELDEILNKHFESPERLSLNEKLLSSPDELKEALSQTDSEVCFALEAWLPPLEESKQLLRNARASIDLKTSIHILLIGHSHPSLSANFEQWKRIVHQLSDPYLSVSLHEA